MLMSAGVNDLLSSALQQHIATMQQLLESSLPKIEESGRLICDALINGRKVLVCGNGGSAADAQHIAAELIGYYENQRRSWPAIALTTDTSALTAVSNDLGFEQVFARQVAGLAQPGDVLIAITTSGKSKNVLRAVEQAKKSECKTIGLVGASAKTLALLCDVVVSVPATRTSRIQEAHITIGHLWCEMVDQIS